MSETQKKLEILGAELKEGVAALVAERDWLRAENAELVKVLGDAISFIDMYRMPEIEINTGKVDVRIGKMRAALEKAKQP